MADMKGEEVVGEKGATGEGEVVADGVEEEVVQVLVWWNRESVHLQVLYINGSYMTRHDC